MYIFQMMKINIFWGGLTSISARTKALVTISVAVLAKISLTSPRKIIIFIIKKTLGLKYPKNKLVFNFEKKLNWLRCSCCAKVATGTRR